MRKTFLGLALATATAAVTLTGCSSLSFQDASCSDGEYPVLAVGSTGSACVSDDENPPKGYARYPEGKEPEHVGDKWDVYWETHTLDTKGRIIEVPGVSETS